MGGITFYNIGDKLYKSVALEAESRGWSWNKTAKDLSGELMGLIYKKKKYRNLSKFLGTWSKEEIEEFDKASAETEKIYPQEW